MRSQKKGRASLGKGGKKNSKIGRNFQGYATSKCVYRDAVKVECYRPPGYFKGSLNGKRFCRDCLLQPCFVTVKKEAINKLVPPLVHHHIWNTLNFCDLQRKEKYIHLKPDWKESIISNVFAHIFSKKYAKKSGLPRCGRRYVDTCMPTGDESDESIGEEDPLVLLDDSPTMDAFLEKKQKVAKAPQMQEKRCCRKALACQTTEEAEDDDDEDEEQEWHDPWFASVASSKAPVSWSEGKKPHKGMQARKPSTEKRSFSFSLPSDKDAGHGSDAEETASCSSDNSEDDSCQSKEAFMSVAEISLMLESK